VLVGGGAVAVVLIALVVTFVALPALIGGPMLKSDVIPDEDFIRVTIPTHATALPTVAPTVTRAAATAIPTPTPSGARSLIDARFALGAPKGWVQNDPFAAWSGGV